METRILKCSKCKTEKLETDFFRNKSHARGRCYWCKACMKLHITPSHEYQVEYRKKNRERINARNRKANMPVARVERKRRVMRERHRADPKRFAQEKRLRIYGLTPEAYNALLSRQGNRCGCCRSDNPGRGGWVVDHDHLTMAVRGILCNPCNLSLGMMRDSVSVALNMAIYLLNAGSIEEFAQRANGLTAEAAEAYRKSAMLEQVITEHREDDDPLSELRTSEAIARLKSGDWQQAANAAEGTI